MTTRFAVVVWGGASMVEQHAECVDGTWAAGAAAAQRRVTCLLEDARRAAVSDRGAVDVVDGV